MSTNTTKRVFRSINWILLEKISKAGLSAITSLLVARYLGAEGLGYLSLALSLFAVFSVVGTLGLERFLLKELEVVNDFGTLLGSALLLRFAGAATAALLINLLIPLLYPQNSLLISMCTILSLAYFFSIGHVFEVVFRQQLEAKLIAFIRVTGLIASACCKLLFIGLSLDIVWFTLPILLETAIVSFSFVYFWQRRYRNSSSPIRLEVSGANTMLRTTWPLLFSGLVGTLYFQVDKLVIFELLDSSALGKYALLFQLVAVLTFIPHAINLSVIPILNRLFVQSSEQFWATYQEVTAFKLLISLAVAAAFISLGNIVIPLLVGETFTYSLSLLLCFSCYLCLVSMGSLHAEYCVLIGMLKPLFYLKAITLIVNLVLNIFLIPRWGLTGAAFTSVACYALNQFVLPCFLKPMLPLISNNLQAISHLVRPQFYRSIYRKIKMLI